MVSWVVQTLLLGALFGAVFAVAPEVQVVKNLVEISNEQFRQRSQTEISLPDIGWLFEPIRYRGGRLGQFDTLELLQDPKIVSRINHYGTVYTFSLNTALRDLTVKYNFFVNYPFFGKHGNLTITVGEKSFQLDGRVLVRHDGSCFAVLQDAKVVKFGDFRVKYEPDDAPFITHIYQLVLNFVHQQMIPLINLSIRTEISKTGFRKQFNKYVCDEVTRNSTTEEPTTYSPTTDQPEPTPSSRSPYDPTTEGPYDPTTEGPYDPSTRSPYDPTTEGPYDPSTRSPYDPTTEGPYDPTTRSPYDPTTESPYYSTDY